MVSVAAVHLSFLHLWAYYLVTLRFSHHYHKIFSRKWLTIYSMLHMLVGSFVFLFIYWSRDTDAFTSSTDTVCYVNYVSRVSQNVTIAAVALVSVLGIVFMVFSAFLVRSLLKKKTENHKKILRNAIVTLTVFNSIPIVMGALPFGGLLLWSTFTSTSEDFAYVGNVCAFVAMSQFLFLIAVTIVGLRPYRRATVALILRRRTPRVVVVVTSAVSQ
uniref:G_PROTEIN_RECEP_F1_2 domain-containing protein n=1 Tax=Steinernema glaseri TaxID=37863 RepID=A0A1I8A2H8_9BILA